MPNHITNIIITNIDLSEYKSIGYDDASKESYEIPFDFRKIIPKPESLSIVSDSLVEKLEPPYSILDKIEVLVKAIKESNEDQVENFCQALKNLNKYGYTTWKNWAIANWGTKWDAYDFGIVAGHLKFETAWNDPKPIFLKLSQLHPTEKIQVIWSNAGFAEIYSTTYLNNKLIEEKVIASVDYYEEEDVYSFKGKEYTDKDQILEYVVSLL